MELNKKKSLLTPAAPTVWGMIHGDISKQQDLIDKINSAVEGVEVDLESWVKEQGYLTEHQSLADYYTKNEVDTAIENVEVDLTGYATEDWVKKQNYLTEHQSLANYYTKSEVDEAISNIEVEVDTSNLATKQELQNLKNNEVQTALSKSDAALTTANSAEQKITELRTYVDEQIGGIDTMTDDILA